MYKPRRQVKGEGVAQMSTLLNKSYLVKVSTKGGGGVKNAPNSVYVVCTQPHMLKNFFEVKEDFVLSNRFADIDIHAMPAKFTVPDFSFGISTMGRFLMQKSCV